MQMGVDVEAGIATFTYNADGQRSAKQSTDASVVGYLYDYKRLLHETDALGGAISKTYASDTTDEFGDLIGEDGEFSHQYDAMANTNALLDETGVVQAQYKYTAFGEVSAVSLDGSGTWSAEDWSTLPLDLSSNMLAGAKKQYYLDFETAMYLLGSGNNGRYYDAATGRFVSEDPIRQAGEDDNLYAYVRDNPVNHLDASGHTQDPNQAKRDEQHDAVENTAQPANADSKAKGSEVTSNTATQERKDHRLAGEALGTNERDWQTDSDGLRRNTSRQAYDQAKREVVPDSSRNAPSSVSSATTAKAPSQPGKDAKGQPPASAAAKPAKQSLLEMKKESLQKTNRLLNQLKDEAARKGDYQMEQKLWDRLQAVALQSKLVEIEENMNNDVAHGGSAGYYKGEMDKFRKELREKFYDSLKPTTWELTKATVKGAAEGAAEGAVNDVKGVIEAGKEVGLEAADVGKELWWWMPEVCGGGGKVHHSSELGKASEDPNFNLEEHVRHTLRSAVTFGLADQAQAVADWMEGKIDSNEMAKRLGTVGIFQILAGKAGKKAPVEEGAGIGKMEAGESTRAAGAEDRLAARDAAAEGPDAGRIHPSEQPAPPSEPAGAPSAAEAKSPAAEVKPAPEAIEAAKVAESAPKEPNSEPKTTQTESASTKEPAMEVKPKADAPAETGASAKPGADAVPESVAEWQQAQNKITQTAQKRVADAIDAAPSGGKKAAKGDELQKIGKQVHEFSDDTIAEAAQAVGAEKPRVNPDIANGKGGLGSQADNLIRKDGKSLYHEKKFQLPKSGEQLKRVKAQLRNIEKMIGKTGNKGILEVAKAPNAKELQNFLKKLSPKVRSAIKAGRIEIVNSLPDLYNSVANFFK